MPELPDVEIMRRHLYRTSLHRKIERTSIATDKILDGASRQLIQAHLKDQQFETTHRHGKYLFVEVDGGCLLLHFGMSGDLRYLHEGDETPDHTRAVFYFKDGSRLAYISQRMLGRISWTEDEQQFIREHELGPDAFKIDAQTFIERFGAKRGAIKPALMDQSTVAGIGNVYSDEVLFRLGWHPKRNVESLSQNDLRKLQRTIRKVLQEAIEYHADPDAMPDRFLLPHRDLPDDCPRCGHKLKKLPVSGRNAILCPKCQSLSD